MLKKKNDGNRNTVLTQEEEEVDQSVTDFHVGRSDDLTLPLFLLH